MSSVTISGCFAAVALFGFASLARADAPPPPGPASTVSPGRSGADLALPQTPARGPLPSCADPEGEGDFQSSTGCSGVFGIRGSVVSVHGVQADQGTGIMFSGEGEEFVRRGIFSTHGTHRLAIGGGGAGFEGTLLGGLAGGFRVPLGDRHGPVFRAGAFGYLRGNNAYYASLLELPQVQVGYQYLRGRTVLELGMTSGAVLVGRHRVGDAERRILGDGLEVGGYAALHVPWVRLGMTLMRLPTNDGLETPVRAAEGTLCVVAVPFAICADGRATSTDVLTTPGAGISEVRSIYAGLAFGFTRER